MGSQGKKTKKSSVDFSKIRKLHDKDEQARNTLITISRGVVQQSKKIINAVHRQQLAEANKGITTIQGSLKKLIAETAKSPKLLYSGAYKIAIQEYVEALCFYIFIKEQRLPTEKELNVEPELYLLGVTDFTGEALRYAVNSVTREDYVVAKETAHVVGMIYEELMLFDFGNGELRKKFDMVKYTVQKLENLMLELKLAGRL